MAVLGGCIWQAHVTKTKLWHHHEAVDVLRDIAGDSPEMLDERYEVPARKLQKITEWMVVVGENKWTQWSPAAAKEATLWSDASDDTWAFVIEKDGVILDFKRGDCSKTDILVSETIALSQGLKAARKEGITVEAMCDNQALVYICEKGLARNNLVNHILTDTPVEGTKVTWVPTHLQAADPLTRGGYLEEVHHRLHLFEMGCPI